MRIIFGEKLDLLKSIYIHQKKLDPHYEECNALFSIN